MDKPVKLYDSNPKTLHFEGYDDEKKDKMIFRPNLTPAQILRKGSFGGTYFRPIYSAVTKQSYKDADKEFPKSWFKGLDRDRQIVKPYGKYDKSVNKYKVKVGLTLEAWEDYGWINEVDPYGWFQWYCRFYRGRRLGEEDDRQIKRFNALSRFVAILVKDIMKKEAETGKPEWNNPDVSKKNRQNLQHWGYQITKKDYDRFKKTGKYKIV